MDERQRLLTLAPHLVRPQLFVLPYQQNMRPTWLLRTGLFLYDNLSRSNQLPKSKFIRRKQGPYFSPLKIQYDKGFLFYDCTTDDSRLTIANALLAKEYGASIYNYMKVVHTRVENRIWILTVQTEQGEEKIFRAKTVINATGPWVESCNALLGIPNQFKLSLVKGSHLVVHKLYEGNHAYLLQHEDKRIVFIVPYHGYTMIGTTDVEFKGSLDEVSISNAEVDYLCALVNHYLRTSVQREDIINTWSGVRPLLAASGELKALSRDYAYSYTDSPAPAVTIYGGKITTYRQLSLEAVNKLKAVFPYLETSQTEHITLPGAKLDNMSYKEYVFYAREKYFWLADDIKERYLADYGTRTEKLLADCKNMTDLGYYFGNGLYQIEVDYLCGEEWAQHCEDILWRRTKLGLNFSPQSLHTLAEYLLHKKQ